MSKTLRVKYHLGIGLANADQEEVMEIDLDIIKEENDCLGLSDEEFEEKYQDKISKFIDDDFESWKQNYMDDAWWFVDEDEE
jgi:hypothetical protein